MIWSPDAQNGSYRNPILYEDYSDPDVCRGKGAFYMTASSFSFVPGLPILKSYDLVHWRLVNYALRRLPEFRYREPVHGCGVWAPAIRFHGGIFYIIFPMPDEGLYMIETEDPEGAWSEPVKLYDGAGLIDPCPFFDDDGRVYLVNGVAKSRIGYKSVLMMSELSHDLTKIIKGPVKIYDGTADGNVTIEGPKLYKRKGFYYIFAPAGGVKTGWQVVLRSRNLYSGWEPHISLRQGSTGVNGPHQGALVTDGAGKDWFVHFQDVFAVGRITHLQPVIWVSDDRTGQQAAGEPVSGAGEQEAAENEALRKREWPVIGEAIPGEDACGQPVLTGNLPTPLAVPTAECPTEKSTTFPSREKGFTASACDRLLEKTDALSAGSQTGESSYNGLYPPLPWQWNANPESDWLSVPAPGVICLKAVAAAEERPLVDLRNLFLRRIGAPEMEFSAALDISGLADGSCAGICISGTTYGGIGILKRNGRLFVRKIRGKQIFDCGAVYADEEVEDIPLFPHEGEAAGVFAEGNSCGESAGKAAKIPGVFRVSVEIKRTNAVTPTSEKPPYRPGDEGEVRHPEEEATLSLFCPGDEYSLSFPLAAGRWTGAKYGFFAFSAEKHCVCAVSVRDMLLK